MLRSMSLPVMLVAFVGLAACEDGSGGTVNIFDDVATVTGGGGQSAEQRNLSQVERQYAQARLVSAGIGGLAGAAICALRECTPEQTAAAVVIGATAGYVGGNELTRQNRAFRHTQESLNRDLNIARQETQSLSRAAAAAESVVSFQRREIARLNQGLRAGTVTREENRAAYRNMQGDLRATQTLISTGNERVSGLNTSINAHGNAGLNTSPLRQQRSTQQREIQRLRNAERAMNNALRSVPPEVRAAS